MMEGFFPGGLAGLSVRVYSVSEVTALVREAVESRFEGGVRVRGEVSSFTRPQSGHCYFTLKDGQAVLNAVMFSRSASMLGFKVENGLMAVCFGRLTVYEPRGQYQMIVEHMEPHGLGALMLRFQQLKEKLEKEGLFDEARKRPLPVLPRKIGIVTSPTGAAVRDMVKIMQRRFPNLSILVCPVKVQGEGAAEEIAQGIQRLNRLGGLDLIIVGRGGGSIEDLWAFNEEVVARAIFSSHVPVVSAVGHERDFTIADFVADKRAKTPSEAAEIVAPEKDALAARVAELRSRTVHGVKSLLERLRMQRDGLSKRLADPRRRIETSRQRLDDLAPRLASAMRLGIETRGRTVKALEERLSAAGPQRALLIARQRVDRAAVAAGTLFRSIVERARKRLAVLAAKLDGLSPLAVLSRGFSITFSIPEGRIIRASGEVEAGDKVNVRLGAGALLCLVEERKK